MLALVITVVFALYVLGPDASSRFILDFVVPRRAVTLTRSQEVFRAVIWAGLSLGLTCLWERWSGAWAKVWSGEQFQTFFAGVYSEQFFRENRQQWFESVHAVLRMNWSLIWRLYTVVIIVSLMLCFTTRYYALVRHWIRADNRTCRVLRKVLAALVLPRVAPWHLLLSNIYVREPDVRIHLDVLTKSDNLYQGRLEEKALSADGNLLSVTLADSQRFRRSDYNEAKRRNQKPDPKAYWAPIPNNLFVIMGAEISTLNIRYVADVGRMKKRVQSTDMEAQLTLLRNLVRQMQAGQTVPSVTAEPKNLHSGA